MTPITGTQMSLIRLKDVLLVVVRIPTSYHWTWKYAGFLPSQLWTKLPFAPFMPQETVSRCRAYVRIYSGKRWLHLWGNTWGYRHYRKEARSWGILTSRRQLRAEFWWRHLWRSCLEDRQDNGRMTYRSLNETAVQLKNCQFWVATKI